MPTGRKSTFVLGFGVLFVTLTALPALALDPVWRGPWSTSVGSYAATVIWEDGSSTGSVKFCKVGNCSYITRTASNASYTLRDGTTKYRHRARLTGLSAGTRYFYVIVNKFNAAGYFNTNPGTDTKEFNAVLFGDYQNGYHDYNSSYNTRGSDTIVQNMYTQYTYLANNSPDLFLTTGDLSDGSTYDYDEHFLLHQGFFRFAPFYPAPGNHDPRTRWQDLFDRTTKTYTYVDYGNTRFIILDCGTDYRGCQLNLVDDDQEDWLIDRVQEAESGGAYYNIIDHIIIVMHMPLWSWCSGPNCHPGALSGGLGGTQIETAQTIGWLAYLSNKVRAVFAGHNHFYQHVNYWGDPLVVMGGGGANFSGYVLPDISGDNLPEVVYQRYPYFFVWLNFTANMITMKVVNASGNVVSSKCVWTPTGCR